MPEDGPEHPSIHEAYGFVLPSYDWMLRRFDAVNGRLQNAVSLVATVPVLSISIIKALMPAARIDSPWLIAAVAVFASAALAGTTMLYKGKDLKVMRPGTIHKRHIDRQPADFKERMLKYAGGAFDHNLSVVLFRARAALLIMLALMAGLILLVVWAWRAS